jgi:hypothetical protein
MRAPIPAGLAGLLGLALVVALGGCGTAVPPPPPVACASAQAVLAALRAAPGAARLADGTPLSGCVSRARSEGDLVQTAQGFIAAADALESRLERDPAAALQLGYLIGATRRGGAHSQGVDAGFVTRMEETAPTRPLSTAGEAALSRGLRAGERTG